MEITNKVYTLDEVKKFYLTNLNKCTDDKDIINTDIEKDFEILANLKVGEGKHFYLSSYYYSGSCDLNDYNEIKFLNQYNWRILIVISVKCIGENQYIMWYGISND